MSKTRAMLQQLEQQASKSATIGMSDTSIRLGSGDPDCQRNVLKALQRRRLEAFVMLLSENVDLEHRFPKGNVTLLMMACMEDGCHEFARALLACGADPNTTDADGRTPLHYAAYQSNDAALELLLADKRTDVNAVDKEGSTALHYTAEPSWNIKHKEKHLRCIALLMDHPLFEVNRPDAIGQTAITTAVLLHYNERIQVMLQHGRGKLNIDCSRVTNGKSVREVIKKRFPELRRFLPPQRLEKMDSPDRHLRLLAALQHKQIDDFRLVLDDDLDGKVDPNHWYDDPYYCTCLELACRTIGCEDFVLALIQAGANPNTANQIYGIPVIHQATESGNHAALEILLNVGKARLDVYTLSHHTALHVAAQKQCAGQIELENIQTCISLLLDHETPHVDSISMATWYDAVDALSRPMIDIDTQDEYGDTALHDAAHYGNKAVVLTLLRRGANIMKKNQDGDPPLAFIDSRTLDTFLDEQVRSNGLSTLSEDYQIIMKYTFLEPSTDNEAKDSEMDALQYISRSEDLKPLLRHPVINSFLYLKWEMVRAFFYINLVYYIAFVGMVTAYILLINTGDNINPNCVNNHSSVKSILSGRMMDSLIDVRNETIMLNVGCDDSDAGNCTSTYLGNLVDGKSRGVTVNSIIRSLLGRNLTCVRSRKRDNEQSMEEFVAHCLRYPLFWMIVALCLRELLQLITGPKAYFKNPENFLEILMILTSSTALSSDWDDSSMKQHISCITILISWAELILMTGRLPMLSIQLEMFKKVCYTFVRFMAWYSLFIIAFALGFYTLFRRSDESTRENTDTFFLDPWMSMLKTVIMMVGEFEASELVFESVPGTSHVVFILFVFLIAIVLLNLLNGLAVSDTQAIKEDAVILSLVSIVRLVSYLERMLLKISYATRFMYGGCYKKLMEPRIRLFKRDLPKKQIHAFPNTGEIKFLLDAETTSRFRRYRMDRDILRRATDIVTERKELTDVQDLKQRIQSYEDRFETLEKSQRTTHELVIEAMTMLTSIKKHVKENSL